MGVHCGCGFVGSRGRRRALSDRAGLGTAPTGRRHPRCAAQSGDVEDTQSGGHRRPASRGTVRPPATAYQRNLPADDEPIAPSDVATAINDLFDRHGAMPMTADIGDCLFTAMEIENTALAAPGYYAGMGFGVPAGIGAAAATGRRPLVLVGDGAFQMTGWELGNCRRYGFDPIVVLFNNASWEMLRAFQPESRFNDLDDWNFAAIAPSLGGYGERVKTRRDLKEALERAVARPGPTPGAKAPPRWNGPCLRRRRSTNSTNCR